MDFSELEGFDWDGGNSAKNWHKHRVTIRECEEVFVNMPFFIFDDVSHSTSESRHYVLGFANGGRLLAISFTVRILRIRVISARPMSKNDRKLYVESIEANS